MPNENVTQIYSGTPGAFQISPDGSKYYVSSATAITVIDAATNTVIRTFNFATPLRGFDISADGGTLAVAAGEDSYAVTAKFIAIDLGTGVRTTYTVPSGTSVKAFNDVAFLADGSLVLSGTSSSRLQLFDFGTGTFTQFGAGAGTNAQLVASTDRDQVVMSGSSRSELFTMGIGITGYTSGTGMSAITENGTRIVLGNYAFDGSLTPRTPLLYPLAAGVFSKDGRTYYGITIDGHVAVYGTQGGWQVQGVFATGIGIGARTNFGDVIKLSADGTHLFITGNNGLYRVDLLNSSFETTNGDDVATSPGTLLGLDGNDTLGGTGVQWMLGGLGDDLYLIDDARDSLRENAGEGYDRLETTVSVTRADYIEEITFTGTGDALLFGGFGDAIIRGGSGNDTLSGSSQDRLDNGNSDTLIGGDGNDTYVEPYGSGLVDSIIEDIDGGIDTVLTRFTYTLLDNVENLTAIYGSFGSRLTGNDLDNIIRGGQNSTLVGLDGNDQLIAQVGANILLGGEGDDRLQGGSGDDLLDGGAGSDRIDGGDGIDTASYAGASAGVAVSIAIARAQDTGGSGIDTLLAVENLEGSLFADTLRGSGANNVLHGLAGDDLLLGGAGNDRLFGGSGNDRLDGGVGVDRMEGGAGDDVYVVETSGETVIELAGEGVDTVRSNGIDVVLGANIERLIIASGSASGTGNGLANVMTGSNGNNVLSGMAGNDVIKGLLGTDTLDGGDGDDWFYGGLARDTLTGGTGADRFFFDTLSDSSSGPVNADVITDFSHAEGDRIGLAQIDAISGTAGNDVFAFIGSAAFSHTAGELRYRYDGNGNTIVQVDVNGDAVSDMSIVLTGEHALVAADFIL